MVEEDNQKTKKKIKKITVKIKKRSIFSESDELEKRLAASKRKIDVDREISLTAENARDEVAHMLLVKALREMFERVDRGQGGSFIHGSMANLSADMWKGLIK